MASASIAQVHQATLKDGRRVAVKIQKPELKNQFYWDFLIYKGIVRAYEWFFDLPVYWTIKYTEQQLRKELDFVNEGKNSERAARDLRNHKNLVIPKVYWDLTTKRILTTGGALDFLFFYSC